MGLDAEHRHMVRPAAGSAAVIGAGPAGLAAAEALASRGIAVTVYERMPSPARKLLMAGRGGLNLTHSEPLAAFLGRYPDAPPALRAAVLAYPPQHLIAWANGLGQDTFVGSSGRVFPRRLKASPLLRAWLARLAVMGVTLKLGHRWLGWTVDGALVFEYGGHEVTVRPGATLLATGGASWARLGSDGTWRDLLEQHGVGVVPFAPSNSGVEVAWSAHMLRHEGQPLKRVAVTVAGRTQRGELVLSRTGLEGGALYALAPELRHCLADAGTTLIHIDLRPDATAAELAGRLGAPRAKQSTANLLRKQLKLTPAAIALLNEAGRLPQEPHAIAARIKAVPVRIDGLGRIDRAISTAGGLPFGALDDHFMIRSLPGVFAAGEMLDWDAPTGGYLLQACFATGIAAADGLAAYLGVGSAGVRTQTLPGGRSEQNLP